MGFFEDLRDDVPLKESCKWRGVVYDSDDRRATALRLLEALYPDGRETDHDLSTAELVARATTLEWLDMLKRYALARQLGERSRGDA